MKKRSKKDPLVFVIQLDLCKRIEFWIIGKMLKEGLEVFCLPFIRSNQGFQ